MTPVNMSSAYARSRAYSIASRPPVKSQFLRISVVGSRFNLSDENGLIM